MAVSNALRKYYRLTKPGIVYGNCMAAAAGFLLAAKRHIDAALLVELLLGMALVIACACVINNYIDRDIDAKMARTRQRALVQGTVSAKAAWLYAALLGAAGFAILSFYTNWLTVSVGFIGLFAYVVVYGWGKRATVWGTLIGSISGSMPLVAGYTAVTDRFDGGAWLLFVLMSIWQLPHFYAIAIYRFNDYKEAGLPVWPVVRGIPSAKRQIILLVVLFMLVTASLSLFGYAGKAYFIATVLLGLVWLGKGLRGFNTADDTTWARGMFGYSLIVLMLWSVMLATNAWLP